MSRPTTRSSSSTPPENDPPNHLSSSSTTDQRLDSILKLLAQPDPRLVEILTRMEQRLDHRFLL